MRVRGHHTRKVLLRYPSPGASHHPLPSGEGFVRNTFLTFEYAAFMDATIKQAIPILPAADTTESLKWWTEICGFTEVFRDATPPNYAGIQRDGAQLHIAGMDDKALSRKVAEQTMVRFAVTGIEDLYAEYQKRGGKVHPNGGLQRKPWGTKEFAAIDPNGVCVTFME
jgi:predicted enzyme related to lactoylglutathione lyase